MLKAEIVKELLKLIPKQVQETGRMTEARLKKMTKSGLESLLKLWKKEKEHMEQQIENTSISTRFVEEKKNDD